jgi:hypothetical protein
MRKNFALLWKVYDHIVAHPEEWHQGAFALRWNLDPSDRSNNLEYIAHHHLDVSKCGTAFCVAGHAVNFSHPDAVFNFENDAFVTIDGHGYHIADVARGDLGLNEEEAAAIFAGFNSLDRIRELIEEWERKEALGV